MAKASRTNSSKSYFDTHAHVHDYHKDPEFYRPLITNLKTMVPPIRLLDLGCGDGSFIRSIAKEGLTGTYLGVDISASMIQTALSGLQGYNDVSLIVADGFNLPVKDHQFDLIHLDSVLHHIVGKTRSESRKLAKNMLSVLLQKLSENGFLLIEEMFYGSHIVSGLTSSTIFYALKLFNFLKLDLGALSKNIIPGLEVNFYSKDELFRILSTYGDVSVIRKRDLRRSSLQRLAGQKEFGHVAFVVRKAKS